MTTRTHTKPTDRRPAPSWTTDLTIALAAVICALVAWFFVVRLPGVDLLVHTGGALRRVGAVDVALAAGVSAVLGLGLLRVLERLTARALAVWTAIALVVALFSMLGTTAATTREGTFALVSLHAVVAAVVLAAGLRSRS